MTGPRPTVAYLWHRDAVINGARALMADRKHPKGSLDLFITPPWATRALMERVLPAMQLPSTYGAHERRRQEAWEPACGHGQMAEVLGEYFAVVWASDIRDYGYAGMDERANFLTLKAPIQQIIPHWIITNPPFRDKTIPFVLQALRFATVGVAMFVRAQWAVEGVERYHKIFKDNPPTQCAFFTERVNLCKGRWNPTGTTATAYCWLVWVKGMVPRPPMWIPPRCRKELSRPDDVKRFASPKRKRR